MIQTPMKNAPPRQERRISETGHDNDIIGDPVLAAQVQIAMILCATFFALGFIARGLL